MPINELNIKLMAPQRLSDTDDGGGMMTGNEIVDGNINNMFLDISRLDRVYGRVSLREAFVAVTTDDQEVYSGCHVIITNPAKDPLVEVCIFSISNHNGLRTEAQNRIESYVTQGPKFFGWLWGNQLLGSRSLLMFMSVDTELPEVGDVLFLLENEDTAEEYSQYVRITEVTSQIITAATQGGSTTRKIATIEIGDPLRHTFHGGEISGLDTLAFPASAYTTTVADAAKYYGAMRLTQPIVDGDITFNVDSIFTHLVPSAQSEAPLLDLSPGEAGPVIESGSQRSVTRASFNVTDGAQLFFGRAMKPGSVTVSASSYSYTDDGSGLLLKGSLVAGKINYALGTVTFEGNDTYTSVVTITAIISTSTSRVSNSTFQAVEINNRGYNYTRILNPPPTPGTLTIDYMSQGKWYRLRDKGRGEMQPDVAGTGTGTVNYISGSCMLTCAALPDSGTAILYAWGNPVEVTAAAGDVTITTPEIDHTVTDFPVAPNSFTVTWPSGGSTASLSDNGSGLLTGDGTGTINYATGRCLFTPTSLPDQGASYSFDYDKYANQTENVVLSVTGGMVSIQLAAAPKENSVELLLAMTVGGVPHTYKITDDGAGNVAADGFEINIKDYWSEWDGLMQISGLSGTVDYVSGLVIVDVSAATIDTMTFDPEYIIEAEG